MEALIVITQGYQVEIKYPYKVLKKIERENKSIFILAKPTIENTEKLIKYGLEHFKNEVPNFEVTEVVVEDVIEQLIKEKGIFDAITLVLKNYMHTLNPNVDLDSNQELDEQGLAQVNNIVSNLLGI